MEEAHLLGVLEHAIVQLGGLVADPVDALVLVVQLLTHRGSKRLEPLRHIGDLAQIVVQLVLEFIVRGRGLELEPGPLLLAYSLLRSGELSTVTRPISGRLSDAIVGIPDF